jgi:hypothetical protein
MTMNISKIQTSITTWMLLSVLYIQVNAQTAMTNIYGRQSTSLNGPWEAIVDHGLVLQKGLISDQGFYKKAWNVMHEYYLRINRPEVVSEK